MTRAGFTLVEVLLATAVVLIGVVGLMQAVTLGSQALDTGRQQQVAQQLVAAELARLRHGPWDTIANLPATATITIGPGGVVTGDTTSFALTNFTAAPGDDDLALSSRAIGFTCTLTTTRLRPVAATAATVTFVRVAYAVSWTGNTGRAHTRRTETYLGRNGLHLSFQRT